MPAPAPAQQRQDADPASGHQGDPPMPPRLRQLTAQIGQGVSAQTQLPRGGSFAPSVHKGVKRCGKPLRSFSDRPAHRRQRCFAFPGLLLLQTPQNLPAPLTHRHPPVLPRTLFPSPAPRLLRWARPEDPAPANRPVAPPNAATAAATCVPTEPILAGKGLRNASAPGLAGARGAVHSPSTPRAPKGLPNARCWPAKRGATGPPAGGASGGRSGAVQTQEVEGWDYFKASLFLKAAFPVSLPDPGGDSLPASEFVPKQDKAPSESHPGSPAGPG